MKKWIIGVLIGFGALALGVGGAFAYDAVNPVDASARPSLANRNSPGRMGQDLPGRGMQIPMRGEQFGDIEEAIISLDDARELALQALAEEYPDAVLSKDAITTRRGYLFEYTVDGETAGAVHVNTRTGQTRFGLVDALPLDTED